MRSLKAQIYIGPHLNFDKITKIIDWVPKSTGDKHKRLLGSLKSHWNGRQWNSLTSHELYSICGITQLVILKFTKMYKLNQIPDFILEHGYYSKVISINDASAIDQDHGWCVDVVRDITISGVKTIPLVDCNYIAIITTFLVLNAIIWYKIRWSEDDC